MMEPCRVGRPLVAGIDRPGVSDEKQDPDLDPHYREKAYGIWIPIAVERWI